MLPMLCVVPDAVVEMPASRDETVTAAAVYEIDTLPSLLARGVCTIPSMSPR